MLTRDDIPSIEVNAEIAAAILGQAEKMHDGVIADMRSIQSKALSLFPTFTTAAITLLGAAGYLYKDTSTGISPVPFLLAGIGFVLGCLLFVVVQQSGTYGANGSHPDDWLEPGWLDAKNDQTAIFNAYLIMQYRTKITVSMRSNKTKRRLLQSGMYCGVAGIVVGATMLAISFARLSGLHLWP
jgi:ABC-type transport system involved in multi-copper enzyme maturation permease subunit